MASYTQTRTYELTYSVVLTATTESVDGTVTLAIPLPPNTPEQTISDLVVHLPDPQEKVDSVFGNRYLTITLEPRSANFEVPVFSCKAAIRPYAAGSNASALRAPPLTLSGGHDRPTGEHGHPTDPRIQTLARNIGRGSTFVDTARKINAHLVKKLIYGDPIDGLYSDLDALLRPRVDCSGYVTLFVSLCLANNIPARIVSGFFLDGSKNDMHAWAEFQDEQGKWIPADPSTEQLARHGRSQKSGRFGFVGSDRLRLSHGCDIPIEHNNKIYTAPILQHPFVVAGGQGIAVRGKITASLSLRHSE